MIFELTEQEKEFITENYGSTKCTLTKAINILNGLGFIEDREDFISILCEIAEEAEAVRMMREPKQHNSLGDGRNLSTIIASVISIRYNNVDVLAPEEREKVKVFIRENLNFDRD